MRELALIHVDDIDMVMILQLVEKDLGGERLSRNRLRQRSDEEDSQDEVSLLGFFVGVAPARCDSRTVRANEGELLIGRAGIPCTFEAARTERLHGLERALFASARPSMMKLDTQLIDGSGAVTELGRVNDVELGPLNVHLQ